MTRDDLTRSRASPSTTASGRTAPPLIELYHRADVFCLPTLGDCLPMVLSEAGAVGLPLVSTDVGAIGEIVRDGETGLLVPGRRRRRRWPPPCAAWPTSPALRRRSATRRGALVRSDFDAGDQRPRLVDLLVAVERVGRRHDAPVLLTVSGTIARDLRTAIAAGRRPRADYLEMAAAFDADLLDHAEAGRTAGTLGRLLDRLAGANAAAGLGLLPAPQASTASCSPTASRSASPTPR